MTPHYNRLREMVLMKSHKICFYGEILKITSVTLLTWSTGIYVVQEQWQDRANFEQGYSVRAGISVEIAAICGKGIYTQQQKDHTKFLALITVIVICSGGLICGASGSAMFALKRYNAEYKALKNHLLT